MSNGKFQQIFYSDSDSGLIGTDKMLFNHVFYCHYLFLIVVKGKPKADAGTKLWNGIKMSWACA